MDKQRKGLGRLLDETSVCSYYSRTLGVHHARLAADVLLDLASHHGLPALIVRLRNFGLEVDDGFGRIQALGATVGAVHDAVAAVQLHGVIDPGKAFRCEFITGVCDPTVRLHKDCRAQVVLRIPPVRGAGGHAARTQNALIHAVELGPVSNGLKVFPDTTTFRALAREDFATCWSVALQPGLNGLVLIVEVCEIRHKILDDIRVWERLNLDCLWAWLDVHQASKAILTLDVHGTGTANALAAGAPESKCGVNLVFDLDEGIENHRTTCVKIDFVFLHEWLGLLFWVVPVNLEFLHVARS